MANRENVLRYWPHAVTVSIGLHGALILAGIGPESRDAREQWTLRDIVPLVREHFGL